jgi:hypothetical protein
MVKRTECKYCGKKIIYSNFDTQIKCYNCLTIHCIEGKKIEPKENMIYSMYPLMETEYHKSGVTFEEKKNKPVHNIYTV